MTVRLFTANDAKWHQHTDRQVFLGDVLDPSNSAAMSVGFIRYEAGARNEWIVTYDEALIVIKGAYTVRSDEGAKTATAGEVLFLTKGTNVVYEAAEHTEVVYVTYPHWMEAQAKSEHAAMLDSFHPVN
ncbi:MAG: cupin [Chloroflexota bacterium]|nr:cupin [Chloroflexota bacterium]